MNDEKRNPGSGPNTRWWESYLVRYFSGAIVGAICLSAILLYADWRMYQGTHTRQSTIEGLSATFAAIALIAGGLVYSYIISSPITVIHFGRYGRSQPEQHVRYFWLGWVIALFGMQFIAPAVNHPIPTGTWAWWIALVLVCLSYLICSQFLDAEQKSQMNARNQGRKVWRQRESRRNFLRSLAWAGLMIFTVVAVSDRLGLRGRPAVMTLLVFSLPTVFVGVMQYVTLMRIFHSERAIHRFYRILSRARALDGARDIRETYTHLREHSNATFIVLLELCVSAFVIFLIEIYAGSSAASNSSHATGLVIESERMLGAVLWLIAFWMTPNLFMWSRANQIERDFSRRPKLYSSIGKPASEAGPRRRRPA